ncbi:helix-turn-helix domain-containing protein [Pedobacter sp. 22226]|uniref:helix-turn-helix domain-containing protein n=1 Tax=Pedobacter sp. 22226 TaxID=3453894 RepID=UPI003F830EDE
MGTIEFITREDLELFKQELFAELRRPTFKVPVDKNKQRPFIKSYEVIKLLGISPGTLQHLRKTGQIKFSKIGGLMYYRYEDIEAMMNGTGR